MIHGAELIRDIEAYAGKPGELGLWWLGQHSFVVKLGATVVYLDAFLSPYEGRQVAPLLTPAQAANADLFLGSHDHLDHIDRPSWPVSPA